MAADLIAKFGYLGIVVLLVLGGLGVPVPEEAPVILAAILSRRGAMWWPYALSACLVGVLLGDFVVYFLGYYYGEKVLSLPLARKFLTPEREEQFKGYFHRHGVKILILGRFAVGFRTAAYLTAGILRLPALKLLITDLFAVALSTFLMFGGGYWFADWIERGVREIQHYFVVILVAAIAIWSLYRYIRGRQRAGRRVGPPILVPGISRPLPPDDLRAEPPKALPAPVAPVEVFAIAEEPFRQGNGRDDADHEPALPPVDPTPLPAQAEAAAQAAPES